MKTNTGLLALGCFAIAGALTVSCGGSDSSDGAPTAGRGGMSSAGSGNAGKPSTAGTTNSSAGTTSNTGGTGSSGGTNNGGRTQGGFGPGVGGAGADLPDCPASAIEGQPCTPMNGMMISACQVDDSTYCICQGQDPTWICPDLGDIGGGGASGSGVTCPANAKSGDACTGFGLCPTVATCGCLGGSVLCQP